MKNLILPLLLLAVFTGCRREAVSSSGIKKATVKIDTMASGLSVEQNNIKKRLEMDNKPGSIKHLYIINSNGECILYSTVKGKVTSSGKRLTPNTLATHQSVIIDNEWEATSEVIQDDGTYGSSQPYVYWWDHKGQYHQHIRSNVVAIHISDSPIRFSAPPRIILASQD